MSVEVLKEVTKWEGNIPNHTYILKNGRLIGYIKSGTTEIIDTPGSKGIGVPFSKSYRKFVKVVL